MIEHRKHTKDRRKETLWRKARKNRKGANFSTWISAGNHFSHMNKCSREQRTKFSEKYFFLTKAHCLATKPLTSLTILTWLINSCIHSKTQYRTSQFLVMYDCRTRYIGVWQVGDQTRDVPLFRYYALFLERQRSQCDFEAFRHCKHN